MTKENCTLIKKEKEKKLFSELSYKYMTEESERDEVVYQRPLSWRSAGIIIVYRWLIKRLWSL